MSTYQNSPQTPRSETTTPRTDAVTAAKETADLLFKKYKSRVGDHWSKEDAVLECNFEDALVEFATHCDHLINSLSALPVERSEREKELEGALNQISLLCCDYKTDPNKLLLSVAAIANPLLQP